MSPNHEVIILQEVGVDQQALVKNLSRYPGEFDVFRELIQNADDADAPIVEVHFETGGVEKFAGEPNDLSKASVRKWIVKNEGRFKEEDWERLGRIAAGNKDSTKVGAFGVGFYTVLSKSDRPVVKSSGKSMHFCRNEDGKLCKWSAPCPEDNWTSVELSLKHPEPLPDLVNLARFLVSSIAFLRNIFTITVLLDGQQLLHIEKASCGSPVEISIPRHLMQTTQPQILSVESIRRTVQGITVVAAERVFASSSMSPSPPANTDDTLVEHSRCSMTDHPTPALGVETILRESTIKHDLYTAEIRVNLHPDSEMKKGVESSMKSLPSSFECKAIYFNSEQHDSLERISRSHLPQAKRLAALLSGPQGIFPENSGRLFIGQGTKETTGIGLHISAHFLPTMERGSIDLANGQVAEWNKEVLRVGGFLARTIYEEEMRIAAESKDELATKLGLRTMARFAFSSTSPYSRVPQILQDAFFSYCDRPKSPFPVVSDVGISCLSVSPFRRSNTQLSFLKRYRTLHEHVDTYQVSQIIERYRIRAFSSSDIVEEFETGITKEVMKSFFDWWEVTKGDPKSTEAIKKKFCKRIASQAVLHFSDEVTIALKDIKHFTFFPLPDDLCPPENLYIDITSGKFTKGAIEWFDWTQLSLLDWLKYACGPARQPAANDPDFGCRILHVLVQFALVQELSPGQWKEVSDRMKDIQCIPTNMGLQLPAESYFDEADICRNLPVAQESGFRDIPGIYVADAGGFRYETVSAEHVRKVLAALRVRLELEWKDMIERLQTSASEESNDRLLHYLATHREKRTGQHINDLKQKRVFYSQNHGRVSATELHFPSEEIFKLGLPILTLSRDGLNSLFQSGLPALEPFLESLGIRRYPSLNKIIELAASSKSEVQKAALQYLLSNLETRYDAYKPDDFADIAFIPTKNGSLACPNKVLASSNWEKLGFKQASLRSRDLSKLGIKDSPSVDMIIKYLEAPEHTFQDPNTAKLWFNHLSQHGNFPILTLRERFSKIPFVPLKSSGPPSSEQLLVKYLPPEECFTSSDTKEHSRYRNIFSFVDFGPNGNSFLESCCAKQSPDATDIVRKIVQNPEKYLIDIENDTELYREDLHMIASRFDSMSDDDKKAMRGSPMFLASQQGKDGSKTLLTHAHKVVIADWESRDFGGHVLLAPKDDAIEKLYRKMGSEYLGTYVEYDIVPICPNDKYEQLPFNGGQVIRRIGYFMRQRDKSERTDVSFYEEGSTDKFRVRACRTLTMKKTFAPPDGILPDSATPKETGTVQVEAGFESCESTLWVVEGSGESTKLYNDVAIALCRILLKSFGTNDMLLLSSLIAMDDERLESYYHNEVSELPTVPPAKEPKKKRKVKISIPAPVARLLGVSARISQSFSQKKISPEDDMKNVIALLCRSGADNQPPDFSARCQRHDTNFKKHNTHCKEAHKITLNTKRNLRDESTQMKVFLAQNSRCQRPPEAALQEFARLISDLAHVFGDGVPKACYIFWKDTDEDLMAFNRDQKYLFFNLAHYNKFFYPKNTKDIDKEKKVITEWFLIMVHEIAHNATLDHDEYHGSLSSRLAIKYLPILLNSFQCFAGDVQLPQTSIPK